jgi:hypothetical protein
MMKLNIKNRCRQIRHRLADSLSRKLGFNAGWLQNHIADCPRCRQRIMRVGNVNLALSLLKTQPHSVDLLMNANTKAVNVLKHSLRNAPKAEKLRKVRPGPGWFQRYSKCAQSILNVAACVMVVLLLKIGTFSSMANLQKEGGDFVEEYYAKHLGQDYADEIFHS